jgi:hypothetical protein
MATYNVLKTSSLLLSIILVMSCASKQQIIENDIEIEQYPKLLFLNYTINKGENGEKTIALINQKTTDGKLKNKSEKKEKTSFGDLECITLDKDLNQIGLHAIKNPLKKIVEYINDFGNFEKKILDLDSAQFSIRLQLQSKVKYVRISELTKEGTKKHITTEIK